MFWFYNDPYFMEDWGAEPRISQRIRLPDGTSIANLEAALSASAERHEALRTFYERPGSEAPRQSVLAAYRPEVTIGPPDAVQPVSMFDRPGFRCQATVDGATVLAAMLVANQVDLDGTSMAMIGREVEVFLFSGGRSRPVIAADRLQPIDVATSELASDFRAAVRGERAVQYFRELREDAPRNFLPSLSWKYGSGNTRSVTLLDKTIMEAATSVADRCAVSTPSVFHAAVCKVVSDWTRTPRFLFTTAVANRWNKKVRDYVGRLASTVDCRFELAPDDTYRSVLKRTHSSLINAYFFANRDIGACMMDNARASETAGSTLASPVLIEYLDYLSNVAIVWPHEGQDIYPGVGEARTDHLWFNISPYRNATSLNVNSDAAVFSETDTIEILRQLVDFIQRAANGLDRPVQRSGDCSDAWAGSPETRWLEFGASRFSANRIEALIERCEGVVAAMVIVSGTDGLVAYVAGVEVDLTEIHERLLVESSHDPLVKIPALYVLTSEQPESAHRAASWQASPVIDQFSPIDDYPARVFVDERFEVLKQVFTECNKSSNVDPTRSYSALGGSYLMIAGMMELLRNSGYTGLDPGDFLGLGSMASLAKRMRREASL
ncbi:condensation domain-containing protein [Glycomyces tritici]|uniref:Condensation domain-containing protein n=1 Tax=Glycomyces tritici TaxID=2665176 RepID=A0ABT7YX30_9ACTN|nr:condensation domain-containing protein [Glycomyces tritici]MDN3243179.1 condensation domain-containing protein [Glycomyces tritici]